MRFSRLIRVTGSAILLSVGIGFVKYGDYAKTIDIPQTIEQMEQSESLQIIEQSFNAGVIFAFGKLLYAYAVTSLTLEFLIFGLDILNSRLKALNERLNKCDSE